MTILTFAKTWPSAHTDSRNGPYTSGPRRRYLHHTLGRERAQRGHRRYDFERSQHVQVNPVEI